MENVDNILGQIVELSWRMKNVFDINASSKNERSIVVVPDCAISSKFGVNIEGNNHGG